MPIHASLDHSCKLVKPKDTRILPAGWIRYTHLLYGTLLLAALSSIASSQALVEGQILDAETGQHIAARLYVEDEQGQAYLVDSGDPAVKAFQYRVDRGSSREIHTAVPTSGFRVELPPGIYSLVVERGKEYLPLRRKLVVKDTPIHLELKLQRWIHMAAEGWYSGDTHIHLPLNQVPLPLMAEDLNVGIPITYWATDTLHNPKDNNRVANAPAKAQLITVESNRVIWPINTEYEIFTVNGKRHTLGAFFAINHRQPLTTSVPPIRETVEEARRQGALLDLDKHNWPWSMMLLPVADIDLYELSNNHIWRTPFLFGDWYPEYVADYMGVELDSQGQLTEQGWIDFGFEVYYSLLNCGFRLRPTAGTAVGVHPVPMGFGRVYVHLDGPFDYEAWIAGLKQGQSFVTTGPMLRTKFNGKPAGTEWKTKGRDTVLVEGIVQSMKPIGRVDIIRNGEVLLSWEPEEQTREGWQYNHEFSKEIEFTESGWLAVRCYEDREDQRPRFAHSGPVFVTIGDQPIRPRVAEVDYMVNRVRNEIQRHRGVLDEASLQEFEEALNYYEKLREIALPE
jgi:hypothetical protein